MNALEIQKYGGTSVDDMERSCKVVAGSRKPSTANLVIVSALSGVTSQLIATVGGINVLSKMGYEDVLRSIAERTHEFIDKNVEPNRAGSLHQLVDERKTESQAYADAMVKLKFFSPIYSSWIYARMGEGLSAPIFHQHLLGAGINAKFYDAKDVMVTDNIYGNANPIINGTRDKVKGQFLGDLNSGKSVVMAGYYGADKDGNITVLPRGGSDRTATAMGQVLTPWFKQVSVYLYKADVSAVMSADPGIVPNAHPVTHLLYGEAAAATAMGTNVINSKAVQHAAGSAAFPIYVRSTQCPDSLGTTIDGIVSANDDCIKLISLIPEATRLQIGGWGMNRAGIMNKITGVLADYEIDIDAIIQPYSKRSLDMAFNFSGDIAQLEEVVKKVLRKEILERDIDKVRTSKVGVIGIIGDVSDPKVLRKISEGIDGEFPEIRRPNPYLLTKGDDEFSIFVALPPEKSKQLTRSLHNSFFGLQK